MEIKFLKNEKYIFMTSKNNIFFYAIYIWKTTKENFKMKKNKNMIYSNMGYNKYMTEHVEPNKYFYVRRGIFKNKSK